MKPNWKHWRLVRQIVQALFFLLFIYLLIAGLRAPLADLFFRLDPLAALTGMLASRTWIPRLGWALVIVGLTLLLGRVWCGWVCPFGTLLEWVSFRPARRRAVPPGWRSVKYALLAAMLAAALFGNLTLDLLDPLALFTRAMTVAILPGFDYLIDTSLKALYGVALLRPAVGWLDGALRGSLLPVTQPVFASSWVAAALFFAILALNLAADRFWCRYLCPLGGLLGWLSKVSILRPVIGQACTGCTRCALLCRPGAIETLPATAETARQVEIAPAECTVCLDCLAACARDGMHYRPVFKPAPAQRFDLSRRQFLQMVAIGAAGAILLKTDLRMRLKHPRLLRPPGMVDEQEFLSKCIRCGECLKVCPTTGLQPARDEAGAEGVWTPVLVPRAGYCDYGCTACGQACPSGAIPPLGLEQKREAVIGKAFVDRDRCLPWASAAPCIVCEEMCPTPEKAIRLEEVSLTNPDGEPITLQRPYVLRDLCIGCGICENHCPLGGQAGILVYSDH